MKKFAIAWCIWDDLDLYQVDANTPEEAILKKFKEIYPDEDSSSYIGTSVKELTSNIWNDYEVDIRIIEIK